MSAEAIKQRITNEERIELLLSDEKLHESRLDRTIIMSRWGSRNIADGSRVQLVVSQKSADGNEGIREHRLMWSYAAEPGYEIDEQYDLANKAYLFNKRSVTFNGQINKGENSQRFKRALLEDDYENVVRLIDQYSQAGQG